MFIFIIIYNLGSYPGGVLIELIYSDLIRFSLHYLPWDFCSAAISVARVVDVSTASISALLKLALSRVCTPAIVVPPGEQTSSFN